MCLCYSYLTSLCPSLRTIAPVFCKIVKLSDASFTMVKSCTTTHKCTPYIKNLTTAVCVLVFVSFTHTHSVSFSPWTRHPSCQQKAVMLNYTYVVLRASLFDWQAGGKIREIQINSMLMSWKFYFQFDYSRSETPEWWKTRWFNGSWQQTKYGTAIIIWWAVWLNGTTFWQIWLITHLSLRGKAAFCCLWISFPTLSLRNYIFIVFVSFLEAAGSCF